MEEGSGVITNALAGEIYHKLQHADYGEMPYNNYRVHFQAGFRDANNDVKEASVEVVEEEGDGMRLYNLIFK